MPCHRTSTAKPCSTPAIAWKPQRASTWCCARPVSFRALAFTIDLGIRGALLLTLFFTLGLLGKFGMGLGALLLFLVQWWYMVLFEVLNQGRTRKILAGAARRA